MSGSQQMPPEWTTASTLGRLSCAMAAGEAAKTAETMKRRILMRAALGAKTAAPENRAAVQHTHKCHERYRWRLSDQGSLLRMGVGVPLFLQLLGNEECQLQGLIGIEARIAMGVVTVRQILFGNRRRAARAFRHVLASHLD